MFFWNSHFFHDPADVGSFISGSSSFSKSSLNIWKFTVHVLLKPGLDNFEHYFTSMWDESNCAVVWAFFDIAFLWDWKENWYTVCEMEHYNKDVTATRDSGPSNVNSSAQEEECLLSGSHSHSPLLLGAGSGNEKHRQQPSSTSYSKPRDVKNQTEVCWPQIDEIHMNGMISVSPDSCIFPYLENQ